MIAYEFKQYLNDTALQYLPITRTKVGNKYNFRCPFCGDSHKSATKKRGWWYTETASYYCFNCGLSLSGIKFLELRAGSGYAEIKKQYVKMLFNSKSNPEQYLSSFQNSLSSFNSENNIFNLKNVVKSEWKNALTNEAYNYLEQRKVFEAPFLKEKFFSCFNKDKTKEFILIPWKINSVDAYYQLNDFKKYNKDLKYIFPPNKKKLLYGLDNIDITFPYIFIFEGVYDSLFVKNGIATGTKSISDIQLDIIKFRYPKHKIVISFDNDEAGIQSTKKLINSNNDFLYFRWFNENTKEKDINDYVISKNNVNIFSNKTVLEKMIVNKLSMKMFLIKNNLWLK